MATRVLLADDDEAHTSVVGLALEEAGYEVQAVRDGMEALVQLRQGRLDLVILDVMLPRMDGWETCRRIRELSAVPILMLTAKEGERNEVRGLHGGADVYMTKPFALSVLLAQVEALLRRERLERGPQKQAVVVVGDLRIDPARQETILAGRTVNLSPTEFRLLATLASRAGTVVPHRELLAEVWGPEYLEEEAYLKLYVWYLRKKIEEDPRRPQFILTKRGRGYYLSKGPASEREGRASTPARPGL